MDEKIHSGQKRTEPEPTDSPDELDQKDESGHKRKLKPSSLSSSDELDEKRCESDNKLMSESSEEEPLSSSPEPPGSILELVNTGLGGHALQMQVELMTEMAEDLVEQGSKELIQTAVIFLELLRKSVEGHFENSDKKTS